jgi:AraC-like DNA-binding protein
MHELHQYSAEFFETEWRDRCEARRAAGEVSRHEDSNRASHYVSALSVDSRAFVNAVLSETGKSPSAWIRDRTLLEARRLLTYTDLTISEIAYRLNFRNVSYFVRLYRRLTGISPGAARAKSVKAS